MLSLIFATILSIFLVDATRVKVEKAMRDAESGVYNARSVDELMSDLSECSHGVLYGLDAHGACKADTNGDGVMDSDADDTCCLDCDPRVPYGRDDEGRCWYASIEGDGLFDTYANGECCDCNPSATYARDEGGKTHGKCRTDINKNGLSDRFAKDICCHDEDMEAVTKNSTDDASHCPEVSVKVPPSSTSPTYRFANRFVEAQQCQSLLQMSARMSHRMAEIIHQNALSQMRELNRLDCVHCVSGRPESVSKGNARFCKINNPGQVNEGGCFVAASNGKPTQIKVEDSCCEQK